MLGGVLSKGQLQGGSARFSIFADKPAVSGNAR
jgi:hypothetical protein